MGEPTKISDETQQRSSSGQFRGLPDELKSFPHWVVWRLETRSGKQTKIPVDPNNGYNAASNQPETWSTYEEAVNFYEACADCAGIGFMFSPDDPFVGIDLDKCRAAETNAIEPWAQEIVDQLNSYTEISPSGTGLHILVKGELPPGGRRKGQMEMYATGRYFTMTGNHLAETLATIEERDQELQTLHARIFKKEADDQVQEGVGPEDKDLSDEDLIAKAKNAANGDKFQRLWQGDFEGYATQSEADLALCSMLAFWTKGEQEQVDRLFRQSGLMRPKWDEVRSAEGKTYGQITIDRAIANLPAKKDHAGKIKEILQVLPQTNSRKEKLEHLTKLVPMLANISHLEAEAVLADLEENFGISDRDIKILKADLKDARKQNRTATVAQASEPQTIMRANFEGLVDVVEDKGTPAFLIMDDGSPKILSQVKKGEDILLPPPIQQIPWLLPRSEEVVRRFAGQESTAGLYDDLKAHLQGISELPGEDYYDLLSAWVFHTYLMENFEYSPIIYLFAVPERGKSRTGKGMVYVCHRGLHVESLREAYLVRVAEHFQAAIFFDVTNIWKKARKANTTDILLHRFEKGPTVPRVLHPDRGPFEDTVYYQVFGPTIIATNEPCVYH